MPLIWALAALNAQRSSVRTEPRLKHSRASSTVSLQCIFIWDLTLLNALQSFATSSLKGCS